MKLIKLWGVYQDYFENTKNNNIIGFFKLNNISQYYKDKNTNKVRLQVVLFKSVIYKKYYL